jgi:hypothetical protein
MSPPPEALPQDGALNVRFSASDAALEGFHLIARRWRVILGWAGFNLLGLVMLVVVTAVLATLSQELGGTERGAAAVVGGGIMLLGVLALEATLAGGVFRLELRPEQPAFLHLRMGADELRLVVVWLISLTGAWVVGWLVAMVGELLKLPGVVLGLLGLVAGVYLSLRFCLAAPVAFAERRVDFMRSWRLTRGVVLPLLGMSVLSLCLILVIGLVVLVVLAALAAALGGFDGIVGLFGGADGLRQHPGLFFLGFAVQILLTPALWVVGVAPLIAAYRAIALAAPAAGAPQPPAVQPAPI